MTKERCFIILIFIVGMSTSLINTDVVQNAAAVLPPPTTCGKINVTANRILGGNPAILGKWRWMAALGYQNTRRNRGNVLIWKCGGTLISNIHVLTAAHCVKDVERGIKLTTVRLGDLDLNDNVTDGASPLDVLVDRIFAHQYYNKFRHTNDIALLKLQKTVNFTEFIQPICLPIESDVRNYDLTEKMLDVAGWGNTHSNDNTNSPGYKPNTVLMEVKVEVMSSADCKNVWLNQGLTIDDKVICAGSEEGGKDSCRGDSGGPLMFIQKKQYFLMGIVSHGHEICGLKGIPGLYTRVPSYMNWIYATLKTI